MRRLPYLLAFLLFAVPAFAIAPGEQAPDFSLLDANGKSVSLSDYKGKTVVLEWFSKHCPFVKKHYRSDDMQALQKSYTDKGVVWLSIDSTASDHSAFVAREEFGELIEKWKIQSTALLADADGSVGKTYGAKTTPHMYIVDAEGNLVYQGAIDDNPDAFADPKMANNYVRSALKEVLAGKPVTIGSTKAYGCSVKYAE